MSIQLTKYMHIVQFLATWRLIHTPISEKVGKHHTLRQKYLLVFCFTVFFNSQN